MGERHNSAEKTFANINLSANQITKELEATKIVQENVKEEYKNVSVILIKDWRSNDLNLYNILDAKKSLGT